MFTSQPRAHFLKTEYDVSLILFWWGGKAFPENEPHSCSMVDRSAPKLSRNSEWEIKPVDVARFEKMHSVEFYCLFSEYISIGLYGMRILCNLFLRVTWHPRNRALTPWHTHITHKPTCLSIYKKAQHTYIAYYFFLSTCLSTYCACIVFQHHY